jgi:hypothetical protein
MFQAVGIVACASVRECPLSRTCVRSALPVPRAIYRGREYESMKYTPATERFTCGPPKARAKSCSTGRLTSSKSNANGAGFSRRTSIPSLRKSYGCAATAKEQSRTATSRNAAWASVRECPPRQGSVETRDAVSPSRTSATTGYRSRKRRRSAHPSCIGATTCPLLP